MNTCRLCGNDDFNGEQLVKYGVRHYVHAECAFKKWGAAFLDRLTEHQICALPYRATKHAGLIEEVKRRLECKA